VDCLYFSAAMSRSYSYALLIL